MYETDLEDLESQLYSQVFHSTEDVDVPKDNLPLIPTTTVQDMTKRNRYFQENAKVSSSKFQNIPNGKFLPPTPNKHHGGYYSKAISKPARYTPAYQTRPQGIFDRLPLNKRKRKKLRALAEKAKKQNQLPPAKPSLGTVPSAHITLTDSEDDDSCIVVENKWPIVSVAESDDETKPPTEGQTDSLMSNSDDVIFVEPVEVPCVVINLDEESEVNANSEKEHVFNSPQTVKQIHQERNELLHTPDSTSNDFINTCGVDLDKTKFNFELHGTDFRSDDLSKNKLNESCETESGSSTTTDLNIPMIIKTAVFSEVDFPRNDLFDENNLENFGKFITPLRQNIAKNAAIVQSSPICKSLPASNTYSSDSSSSESDFDEDTTKQSTNQKKLPDLSPMHPPSQQKDALEEIAGNCKLSKRKLNRERNKRKKRKSTNIDTQIEPPATNNTFSKNKCNEDATPLANEEISIHNLFAHRRRPSTKENEEKKISTLSQRRRPLMNQTENKKSSNETSENTKGKPRKKPVINQKLENRIEEEVIGEVDINLARESSSDTQESIKKKGKKKYSVNNQEMENTKESLSNIEDNEEGSDKNLSMQSSNEAQGSSKRKGKKRPLISLDSENKHSEESCSTGDGQENESDKSQSKNSCIESQEGLKRKVRKKSISNHETEDKVTNETISKADHLEEEDEKNLRKTSFSEANDSSKRKGRKKSINSQEAEETVIEEAKHSEESGDKTQSKKSSDETPESSKGKTKKKSITNQETENVDSEGTNIEHSGNKEHAENLNNKTVEPKDVNEPTKTVDVNGKENNNISAEIKEADNSQLKDFVIIDETFADDSKVINESDDESVLSALNVDVDINLANCQIQSEHKQNDSTGTSLTRPALNLVVATVGEIQRSMSNDRNMWKILDSDKYPGRRPSGRRCNRCRDKGHIGIRCPKNITPTCYICGAKDHYEPRCPKKICTQCGQQRNYFTTYCSECFNLRFYQCTICSMMGHSEDKCPDLWRRYHLTTEEGPLNISEAPSLKPIEEQWCSACAQSGHLEFTCNYVRLYPPHDPRIQCYEDVLSSDADNTLLQNRSSDMLSPQRNYNNFNRGNHFSPLPIFDLGGYTDFSLPYNNMLNNVPNIGAIADLSRLLLPYTTNLAPSSYSHQDQNRHHQQNRNFSPRKAPEYYRTPHNNRERQIDNKPSTYERPQHSRTSRKNVIDHDSRHALANHIIKATELWNKKSNSIFFNGSTERIAGVISDSLSDLSKLSLKSRQDPVQFKKSLNFNKHNLREKLGYYKTLNMVLFGIYNLVDGKMHLSRLKAMKFNKGKTKLNNIRRQELMTSYAYIFGNKKNDGIDYNELLRRI